jgi:hypothetical protein
MIIGIDFDGTVCRNEFPGVGETLPNVVSVLTKLVEKGHKLILWTCRGDQELVDAIQWFYENKIPLAAVNNNTKDTNFTSSKKIYYDILIDDRSLGVPTFNDDGQQSVNWHEVYMYFRRKGIL